MKGLASACLAAAMLFSGSVHAHSFGKLYTLPVPLWMYTWGASASLILSFLMVGWFVTHQNVRHEPWSRDISHSLLARVLISPASLSLFRFFSLAGLLLCIASGLFGTRNAYLNFNMTFFWIVFLLGFSYFTALFGGLYPAINPWISLSRMASVLPRISFHGQLSYPAHLGSWPAFVFYVIFIWIELFAGAKPLGLSGLLMAYAAINLLGAWLVGARDWFTHAEFFTVLFRLISKMAPLRYLPADTAGQGRLVLQRPFSGLLQSRATSLSELLFVLFILSSTAFDGLHQTDFWARLYWQDIAGWLKPWTGDNIVQAYPVLRELHLWFQTTALLLSPFIYLAAYMLCMVIMKHITGSSRSLQELALVFAYSLLPIALVYHITHYYTLILTQGTMIIRLASDPFGKGWNLFGTAHLLPKPIIPNMNWVWHTQVWMILLGHIVSVYLAHREALNIFPDRRTAISSQLPMLVLMVGFTCFGLWILAQPITATVIPQ